MNKLFLIVLACLMLSTLHGEAQILGKIKSKVKEATGEENSSTNSSTTNSNQNSSGNSTQNMVNNGKKIVDPFAPVKDYGMTDEIHAKHLKQIVFSKTPIEFKQGKEEQLTNKFNLNDDIYFMAYFENSFKNQWLKEKVDIPTNSIVYVYIWFEVNGQIVGKDQPNSFEIEHGNTYPEQVEKWTGMSFPQNSLAKCESHNKNNPQLAFHAYVVPVLKPGDNKVKMFLSFDVHEDMQSGRSYSDPKKELKKLFSPAQPMATGEMTITVKSLADIKNMLFNNGFINKPAQSNPALEKQIITVYNANSTESKAVKSMIMYDDWSIRRDNLGNIISRYMEVKVICTTKDPSLYQIWTNEVAQNYTGGGQYSTKIVLSPVMEDPYMVSSLLFK